MPKRKVLGLQGHSSTPGFPFSRDFTAWGIYVEIQMARHSAHLRGVLFYINALGSVQYLEGIKREWLLQPARHK